MLDVFKNFAKATVDGLYDAAVTEIALVGGHGARLPGIGITGGFNAVWWNSTEYGDPSDDPNVEIVRVTANVADTLTIVRGQESTAPATHNLAGRIYKLIATLTAKSLNTDVPTSFEMVESGGSLKHTITLVQINGIWTFDIDQTGH